MKKIFKRRLKAFDRGFFAGYAEGVGTGMVEAMWILEQQQAKFGDIARIEDMLSLINKDIATTVKDYKDAQSAVTY